MSTTEEIALLRQTIEEKEQTIQQLSKKAQWLDLIFDHAPINIYIKNSSGCFVAVNKEFENSFSIKSEEIVNKPPIHLNKDELKLAQEHDQRIFDSGRSSEQEETIGSRVYRVIKFPVFDAEGKPVQIIGFDIDVTELKRTQQELLERNRELEAFSYMVAHDLKAPARRIKAFAGLLMQEQVEHLSPDAFQHVEYISNSAELLGQLIDDLLKISQLGAGAIRFEPLNLTSLMATVVQETAASHGGLKEDMIQINGPLPEIEGHSLTLKLVFQNLFENGLKFVTPGISPQIVVNASLGHGNCTLTVRDNGIGIAPEHLGDIFGTFKRLHTNEEYPGTGIGLAIVKKAVMLHDGAVWAESEPGVGSTFFVNLPVVQPKK